MKPELLITVETELEHTNEAEKQDVEDGGVEKEKEAEDDRATAVQIAQYLRVNKYR